MRNDDDADARDERFAQRVLWRVGIVGATILVLTAWRVIAAFLER
jgi:hypothetical protein